MQLTNILRDLGEDARRGRVYLPQEDLAACGYTVQEVARRRRQRRLLCGSCGWRSSGRKAIIAALPNLPRWLHKDGRRIYGLMMERLPRAAGHYSPAARRRLFAADSAGRMEEGLPGGEVDALAGGGEGL